MIISLAHITLALDGIETLAAEAASVNDLRRFESPPGTAPDWTLRFVDHFDREDIPQGIKHRNRIGSAEDETRLWVSAPYASLLIHWPSHSLTVLFPPQATVRPAEENVTQLLRAVLSLVTVHDGGIAIHASAIYRDDRALLFTGHSGKGKSTIASRLCPPWSAGHDDFNFIVPTDNESAYRVYGTPLGKGATAATGAAHPQLETIFLLAKGQSRSRIQELPKAEQIMRLSENIYMPRFSGGLSERLLTNIGQFCTTIPVRALTVHDDNDPTPLLRLVDEVFNAV